MRASSFGVGMLLVVLGAGAVAARARPAARVAAATRYEDMYYLPPAEWLPTLSLGYRAALADLVWMRALVYFGDEMIHRGQLAHVFEYAEAMLALDPDFQAVYHWIGVAGVYRPSEVTAEQVRTAVDIMRRGLERFPDDGRLAWEIGSTLAFELAPLLRDDPAARDATRAEAADYIAMAARRGAAPPWAVLSGASLLRRAGRVDAAVRHLEQLYALVQDESVRFEIEARLAELRSVAYAEQFAAANEEEELRRLRELPYVPADLYFLVGPRPPVDWRAAFRHGLAREMLRSESVVLDTDADEEEDR